MKRVIRRGAFETNSSSMHSLLITKTDEHYSEKEIMEGICLWNDGKWSVWSSNLVFGRSPFRCLATFESKWRYALAALVGWEGLPHKRYTELECIAFKYIPGIKKITLDTHTKTKYKKSDEHPDGATEEDMEALCGDEFDFWNSRDGESWCYEQYDTGSVDEDILSGFLKKYNISLEEFITNKRYIVICDGDEYGIFDDMKDCGLINEDLIEEEYGS